MQLVDLLLKELEAVGVNQLFGIPGDFVLPLFEQLEQRQQMPITYLSHEPSAAFAADAAARVLNKPATVILTYGAGALNAVNAVAQAYVEHVPLIIIAGYPSAAEKARNLMIHHQARHYDSQQAIYREITACQVRLDDPNTAAQQLRDALDCCVEQSLPVLIELPRDAVSFDLQPQPPSQPASLDLDLLNHCTQAITERLKQAKRPVVLVDVDVRRFDAVTALEAMSETLRIPLISTFLGRGTLSSGHPQYAGLFLDRSDSCATELLAESDLIILAGVIQTDSNFAANLALFPEERVIDLQQGRCQVGAEQFIGLPLSAIFMALAKDSGLEPFEQQKLIHRHHAEHESADASDNELTPAGVVKHIHQLLSQQDEKVPFISDVGDCLFASLEADPTLLLAPAFYASMGYAVPAALGVQLATGLRPVVLVGDGAFRMTGLELGHCSRYGLSPIVILFNNGCWEMIRAFAPSLQCSGMGEWQYAGLARAMGGEGIVVRDADAFAAAFAKARNTPDKMVLIEVQYEVGKRTDRLSRFAEGFLGAGRVCSAV